MSGFSLQRMMLGRRLTVTIVTTEIIGGFEDGPAQGRKRRLLNGSGAESACQAGLA